MNKDSFVCFVVKGQPTINESYDSLLNMNASKILSKMKYESQYLYIHSPLYTKPLQMDSFPLKDFKELAISKKCQKYERPEYYLTIDSTLNYIEICVTPKSKPDFEIPPYYVKFSQNELSKMAAIDVKNTIQQQFGFPINSVKLYFHDSFENCEQTENNEENIRRTESTESIDSVDIPIDNRIITDEESAESIIETAQSKMLFAFFEFPDETVSKIKKRINILSEIISTEKTYINDLTIINDHWKPGIQNLLDPDDSQVVFKDISVIRSCHQSFLADLESAGSKYGSKVAVPFIEFSNFFKVAQQYIANYPTINDILKGYEENKKIKKKMIEIAYSLDGRDLYSYLITPVQRMPRYLLFLRDLIKVTLQSHPDSELLSFAYECIEEVTKKIDKATETSKNQKILMSLQKQITNFTFLDKQRNLALSTNVSIADGSTLQKGEILVFDDLIVVVKKGKTSSKAIFDSSIQRFHFQSQKPDNLSITVDSTNKKYISAHRKSKQKNELFYALKFANNEDMQKFFEEIGKLQEMEMFKFEKSSNQYIFQWNATLLQLPLPPISNPFISAFEGSLFIISCKKDSQNPSLPVAPEFYRVALSNKTIFKAEAKFPSLKLPISIATYKKTLYFINEDKFYKCDPKTNKLTTIQATFTPRVGHTSVFCGDNLMIFGGKSTLTNQMLNDLIVYNVTRDIMMVVNPNESTPQPRWKHCSFAHKDKLYIFGGKTQNGTISNDLYSYDLGTSTWTKIQTTGGQLIPRKSGKTVTSGHYVIFIGGESNNNKKNDTTNHENEANPYINQPQILNLKKKIVYTVENFGNVPDSLTHFDAVFSPNNSFSLCLITSNNLYNISTPAILQKSSSSKHFDESDEAKRRGSHDNSSFFPFDMTATKRNHQRSQSPHAVSKKQKKKDRNSLTFEHDTKIDNHEKPLNEHEKLLFKEEEELGNEQPHYSYSQTSEEYSEADREDPSKHKHRKRGKTHAPLPPKPKAASAQSSQERFIDIIYHKEEENENDKNKKAELSICNAFPESLQILRDEIDQKENESKENKTIQVEKPNSPKKIEEVVNISLHLNDNKPNKIESKSGPKKIENCVNISLNNENKNTAVHRERSINIQEDVEKTMDVSFSFENQGDNENNEQGEKLTSHNNIEKVMNISHFYENNENVNNNNQTEELSNDNNDNIGAFIYSGKNNAVNLRMNENLVFEIEEEAREEKSGIPVVAIAATAAISALLTAGAFFAFKRMRK